MDIKGACGCAWAYVLPGVTPDDEVDAEADVRSMVIAHAHKLGHSPTVVIVREEFYSDVMQEA